MIAVINQSKFRISFFLRLFFLLLFVSSLVFTLIITSPEANADYGLPSWWAGTCDNGVLNGQLHNKGAKLDATWKGLQSCSGGNHYYSKFGGQSKSGIEEWQCVELVFRYLYFAFGQTVYSLGNNNPGGKDIVNDYPANPGIKLQKVPNNSTQKQGPQTGDVLSFGPYGTNLAGHTAIVTKGVLSGGTGYITIFQQNGGGLGAFFSKIHVTNYVIDNPGQYRLGPVINWLHDPSSPPTPTPTPTQSPSPTPPPYNGFEWLRGIAAVSSTNVWAVGDYYTQSNQNDQTLIEQWNGNTWSIVPSPNPGVKGDQLNSVAVASATDVWAVGYHTDSNGGTYTLIEQWNGTSWHVVSSPSPGVGGYNDELTGVVAISANDVWAVGSYDSNGNYLTLIEQWNGTSWNVVSSPSPSYLNNNLTSVAAISATDVWAVGDYEASAGQNTLTEQWNGTSWNVVSSPNTGSSDDDYLTSTMAASATEVWATGFYNSSGNTQTLTEQWNGSNWNIVSPPNPSPYSGELEGGTVISSSNAWSVGNSYSNGSYLTLIEQWNGSTWNVVSSPNPGGYNYLYGVASISANDVWAIGSYQNSNGYDQTLAEQWNGTNWSIIPSP